jgi:ArsR family transcriptional regulator
MATPHKPLTDDALELIATRFRVLAEPMRLKLLNTLGADELSVSELVLATGASQANVSKHLGLLLENGLVARRKVGLNVLYRIADASIFNLCELVCDSLSERLENQRAALTQRTLTTA